MAIEIRRYYFELENNIQRSRCARDVTHDRDPDTYGEIVKTLDRHYLSDDQRRIPNGDAKVSSAGR